MRRHRTAWLAFSMIFVWFVILASLSCAGSGSSGTPRGNGTPGGTGSVTGTNPNPTPGTGTPSGTTPAPTPPGGTAGPTTTPPTGGTGTTPAPPTGSITGIPAPPSGGTGATPTPTPGGGTFSRTAPGGTSEFLFASGPNINAIAAWRIDTSTGFLTSVAGSPFPTLGQTPQGMAVHPSGRFLYVVNAGTGGVSAYSISAGTGELFVIGTEVLDTQQAGAGLIRILVDSAGTHAYVAAVASLDAASFTIDPTTGVLTPLKPQPFDFQSHHLTQDLVIADRTVYLTFAGGIWGDAINADGSLTRTATTPALTSVGLMRLIAAAGGKFLYATTSTTFAGPGGPPPPSDTGHIFGWSVNADGSLTQLPSTPVPVTGVQAIATVGDFLIAASPAGMTVFTIDANSGSLTQVTSSPFPAGTQVSDLNIDPSGRFLYAASQNGIAAFTIGNGGVLTQVSGSPFSTGNLQVFALASGRQ